MSGSPTRHRRPAVLLAVGALVWSAGLVVAGLLWPAYSTSETSPDGVTLGHATLVEVNGARALVLVAIPLLVSCEVLWAIRAGRAGAGRAGAGRAGAGRVGAGWARATAWVAIGLVTVESLLGILTIGLFILPVPILLATAMRRAPGPVSHGDGTSDGPAGLPTGA